ncbi:FG-GAP-like repeat-containing protein [Hymenobacter sp. ASUV-10]|uniref:FG-GAP-like repeat-containing protein n=1 Tax=Hymenobacter aranciens TaxID=3063996 RepID=A0ABT9BBK4_9BACT|nr:FG-GAP-like repeat-containing protein [Hymenobacter sp. ASUV-10]MDO7875654.1 FG-GAP-like repeat-containing protein [Hymenobacter sp. ASUV-10]
MMLPLTTPARSTGGFFSWQCRAGGLLALLGLAALPAQAQLTVTGSTPAALAPTAPVTTGVGVTFSQAPTAVSATNIKVIGSQSGPRPAGPPTVSGTTATLPLASSFLPGEVVSVTVPSTVRSSAGLAARPYVYQFSTAAAAAAAVFLNRQEANHGPGFDTRDATVVDLNGDGLNDLVFAMDDELIVRLGQGGGSFAASSYYDLNPNANNLSLAVGDVTGDGRPDVVSLFTLSGSGGPYLRVLPGTTTGFGLPTNLSLSAVPTDLVLGDVNADGQLDIVLSNAAANSVTAVLATGSSLIPRTYATGTTPGPLALGDLDADGRLDLVVGTSTGYSVLLGGTGTTIFGTATNYATERPQQVLLRDVDLDGRLDLVSTAAGSRLASVRPGQAGATFGPAQTYDMGHTVRQLALGDLNGDGRPDLASVSQNNGGTTEGTPGLNLRLSTGPGTFGPAYTYATGTAISRRELAIGDLDGDQQLDLLTIGTSAPGSLGIGSGVSDVLLNGAAIAPVITSLSPASALPGASITINGSNLQGISSLTFSSFNGTTITVTGFGINAAGTQLTGVVVPTAAQTGPLTVTTAGGSASSTFTLTAPAFRLLDYAPGPAATLAAGAPLELVFSQMPTVASLAGIRAYGVSSGRTRAAGPATVSGLTATVPLTGPAFEPGEEVRVVLPPSIVSSNGASLALADFTLRMASGVSSGGFANRTDSNTSSSKFMTVGDVTGDGQLDLITANLQAFTISVLPGNGQGSFGPKTDYPTTHQPITVALGDVNNDGRTDMVTANPYWTGTVDGFTLDIFLAQAGGGFGSGSSCPTSGRPTSVALSDVDGDGLLDAIVCAQSNPTNGSLGSVNVMRNTGNASPRFVSVGVYTVDFAPSHVTLGDLNHDGRLDIVTTNSGGQSFSVLLAQAGGGYATAVDYFTGVASVRSVLGDIDRDGNLDIATVNFGGPSTINGASIAVRLGTGTGTFGARTLYNGSSYTFQNFDMADLNGDGILDLMTASVGPNAAPLRQVLVNLGTPAGTFGPAVVYQSVGRPGSVLAADVDRDGRLDLVVSNPDQGTGMTSVFFSVLAPTISSFTPTSGPAGTTVTITGTNLTATSQITIGGVAVAPGFVVNAAGTQITGVVVPALALTGALALTTPGGTVTAATPFTVTVPAYDDCAGALPLTASGTCVPTLASVALATQSQAPTACSALTSTTARDAWFSFVATGLTPTVRATSVFNGVLEVFNGGACGSLSSRTCANAVANAGVSGTESITLTGLTTGTRYFVRYYPFTSTSVPFPTDGSFSICLTVPAPSITSFTPGTGTAGTVVTVFGLNLLTASAVTVGGVPVTGFTVNGAGNSLTFTLPAGVGTGVIAITTSGGTATSSTSLVVASPQLAVTQGATAYPNNGPTPYTFAARSTGTVSAAVLFTLSNPGTQALTISGIATTGDFAISGAVPTSVAANGGTATVGVTFGPTADGARTGTLVITSNIGTYTVALAGTGLAAPPTISSISPNPVAPGGTVTITGTNLTGATVLVGNTSITGVTVAANGTSLTFVVPAGLAAGTIQVTTPAGTATSTSSLCVRYTPTVQGASACPGNTVVLSADGAAGNTYNWYATATSATPLFTSTNTTFVTPILTTTTSYYVAISSGPGCEGPRQVVTATINPAPTVVVSAGGPTTFCQGGSVVLTASGAATYLWSTGATTASITVSTTGSYTVTGTSAAGCAATSAATAVSVTPTPGIPMATPAGRCGPGAVTLTASGAPAGGSYAWYTQASGGTAIAGVTGASYTTPSLSTSTTYYVSALSSTGCPSPRQAVAATINAVPTVTVSTGGPTTFCQGGSVTLTASGASSYLWSTGATTASITVAAGGSYIVTGTTAAGCSATSAATVVTVNALPTATITAGGPTTFCQGGSVVLTASGGTSYLWSNGATTPSITVTASGSYTVTATNAAGCSATSSATAVTVNALPTSVAVTASGPTSICPGSSVTLTASGASTYLWNNGATTASITVSTAGSYSVTGTNAAGCSATSAPTTVSVAAPPTVTIAAGGPTTFCPGGSVVLTASGATSYVWSTGATTASITVNASGSYTVTGTNAAGCTATSAATTVTVDALPTATITAGGPTTFCVGGSVVLTASGGVSYLWSNGATTPSITVSTAGSYTVTATSAAGCSATSAATPVVIEALPTATIAAGGATTFCQGGSVVLTASGGTSYLWSNGATTASITVSTAGSYTVTTTNAAGCTATSAATTVTVDALPTAGIAASGATTFCQGGSVVLTASGGASYLWSTGATTASITVNASGAYTVTATNAAGCAATSAATAVTVEPLPATPVITQASPGTLTSSAPAGNQWYLGGVAIPGATGATYVVPGPAGNGNYTLVVTSATGCASAASAPVAVVITGTAAASRGTMLELFPNPATSTFTVRLAAGHAASGGVLYNALGQSVRTLPAFTTSLSVDVQALPTGVYVLRLDCNGQQLTRRVVVE